MIKGLYGLFFRSFLTEILTNHVAQRLQCHMASAKNAACDMFNPASKAVHLWTKKLQTQANELVKNLNQVDRLLRLPFRSVFVLHLRHSPHRYQLFSLLGHQKYTTTGVKFPCQRFTGSSAPGKPTRTSLRDVTQAPTICRLPFSCENSGSAPEINASGREVNPA